MSKTAKRKSIYRETYKNDVEFSNKAEIIELINQPNVTFNLTGQNMRTSRQYGER